MIPPGVTDLACAVDSHAHVYDVERYPFHPSSAFTLLPNEPGNAAAYRAVLDAHGITHALLVQPLGGYGVDNRYLLEAIAASGGRFRGVAVVPHDIGDRELDALGAGGVVGVRFNLNHAASPPLEGPDGSRTLARTRERGWFAQIHFEGDRIVAALPILERSGIDLVVDHCGRPEMERGLGQPGFQALVALGRAGRAAVKLSGVFRFSRAGSPYIDADPYAQALIEAFTVDRCVWGSDWPFVRAKARVDYGPLLACLARWFPDPGDRRKVLWDNPARLFGFAALAPDRRSA